MREGVACLTCEAVKRMPVVLLLEGYHTMGLLLCCLVLVRDAALHLGRYMRTPNIATR